MANIPSHDGPSTAIFDYSHNETNYGKYINTGQHAGVIHNHQTTNNQSTRSTPLGMLTLPIYQ